MTVAEELYKEGWQEGREEGREQGREEGREQGREEGQRRSVLAALEARFGIVPPDVRQKVLSLRLERELSQAIKRAVTCGSLADFISSSES